VFEGELLARLTTYEPEWPFSVRWYDFELYSVQGGKMLLVITYSSRPAKSEAETPHLSLIDCWTKLEVVQALKAYDLFQNVHLDYTCGGHAAIMEMPSQTKDKLKVNWAAAIETFRKQIWDL
jgi:hypothetical protein